MIGSEISVSICTRWTPTSLLHLWWAGHRGYKESWGTIEVSFGRQCQSGRTPSDLMIMPASRTQAIFLSLRETWPARAKSLKNGISWSLGWMLFECPSTPILLAMWPPRLTLCIAPLGVTALRFLLSFQWVLLQSQRLQIIKAKICFSF